jgi:hypothetical protein
MTLGGATAARGRTLDEVYTHARRAAQGMFILSLAGFIAAGMLLLTAFLLVGFSGEQARVVAMPVAVAALAIGACSIFLRRAAHRYRAAQARRDFVALVDGIKYETAYWRTSAICALVVASAIALPFVIAKITSTFAPEPAQRTVATMRVLSAALEQYAAQHRSYPNTTKLTVLARVLRPHLQSDMPTVDGWGNDFVYRAVCEQQQCFDYRLTSFGANGVMDVKVEELVENAYYFCRGCAIPPRDIEIVHGSGRFLLMPKNLRGASD